MVVIMVIIIFSNMRIWGSSRGSQKKSAYLFTYIISTRRIGSDEISLGGGRESERGKRVAEGMIYKYPPTMLDLRRIALWFF